MQTENIFEELTEAATSPASVCTVACHCNALVENDFSWEDGEEQDDKGENEE